MNKITGLSKERQLGGSDKEPTDVELRKKILGWHTNQQYQRNYIDDDEHEKLLLEHEIKMARQGYKT